MRILLIGDIVGKPGRQIVLRAVPGLRMAERLDLVVANAENAAGGSGLTPAVYQELVGGGIDCITMGDHIYRRREIYSVLEAEDRIVRPANYPDEAPGRPYTIVRARSAPATSQNERGEPTGTSARDPLPPPGPPPLGTPVAVLNLLGRIFMPPVDCPLKAADQVLAQLPAEVKVILVDYHAEATSDKQILGRYLDGRVSAVLGTHTHVATADEQILPGGTAFQCDVGMTGPHWSIIGRRIDRVLHTARTFQPTHFEVAHGDCRLHGTIVEVDATTGRARAIRRLVVDEAEADRLAALAGRAKVLAATDDADAEPPAP